MVTLCLLSWTPSVAIVRNLDGLSVVEKNAGNGLQRWAEDILWGKSLIELAAFTKFMRAILAIS